MNTTQPQQNNNNEKRVNSYKDLIVWQKAMELVTAIYGVTKNLPENEKLNLINDLNNTVISIPASVAEGWGKESPVNYITSLRNARAALMKVETLLLVASQLGYIDEVTLSDNTYRIEESTRVLQGLIKSMQLRINNKGQDNSSARKPQESQPTERNYNSF